MNYMHRASKADGITSYHIWVLAASEVEIDVLTGEYKVRDKSGDFFCIFFGATTN